jgi:hypothetical protein
VNNGLRITDYGLRTRIILAGADDEAGGGAGMSYVPRTLTSAAALALGVGATLLAGVAVSVAVAFVFVVGGSEKFGGMVRV